MLQIRMSGTHVANARPLPRDRDGISGRGPTRPRRLLRGRIERNGTGISCAVGELHLPAPPVLAAYDGADVAVGVRPESLVDPTHADPEAPRIRGRVRFVELLGAERLLQIELTARPVATDEAAEADRADEALVTARFEAHARVDTGDLAEVAVSTDRLHFFDLTTGRAIR